MKNIVKIISVVCFLFTISSCESWLDIDPKTSVKSESLFESEEGFKQALTGIYLKISEPALYGKEGTFLFMDILSGVYQTEAENVEDSPYYNAFNRNYNTTDVRANIDDIWSNTFTAIANINNLIDALETETVVREDVAGVILGEALGLRAYLHFDMLRMFGPGQLENNAAALDEIVIPYVTEFNKNLNERKKVSEVLSLIHEDLNRSIDLLDRFGPLGLNHDPDWDLPNKDGYFSYLSGEVTDENRGKHNPRGYRFNYWSSVVTKARVAMWEGDYETALPLAESFINENTHIEWVNVEKDIKLNPQTFGRDMTLSREYIFGLDVYQLYTGSKLNEYFNYSTATYASNNKALYLNKDDFRELYEVDGTNTDGAPDIRQLYAFKELDGKMFNAKFDVPSTTSPYGDRVCLIRKSEPYYMAAECLLKLNTRKDDAVKYIERVRLSRQITALLDDTSDEGIASAIEREYMKELIGDGQLFFYFKRTGATSVPYLGDVTFTPDDFVFPFPLSEESYGTGY